MNKITIVGNLGRDPELRFLPTGRSVAHFSVASNRRYTADDGESREEPNGSISALGDAWRRYATST